MNRWSIHELAILSVKDFTFGVDASQIKEIVTTKNPVYWVAPDQKYPFVVVWHHNVPLPVFNLLKQFQRSRHPEGSWTPPSPFTFVTFFRAELLVACSIDAVESFTSVSLSALKPVPAILTTAARRSCVWGFYEMSDVLVPLINFEHIVTDQDIALYKKIQRSL